MKDSFKEILLVSLAAALIVFAVWLLCKYLLGYVFTTFWR